MCRGEFVPMCYKNGSMLIVNDILHVYVGILLDVFADHLKSRLRGISKWCKCIKLSSNSQKRLFMAVSSKVVETENLSW